MKLINYIFFLINFFIGGLNLFNGAIMNLTKIGYILAFGISLVSICFAGYYLREIVREIIKEVKK